MKIIDTRIEGHESVEPYMKLDYIHNGGLSCCGEMTPDIIKKWQRKYKGSDVMIIYNYGLTFATKI